MYYTQLNLSIRSSYSYSEVVWVCVCVCVCDIWIWWAYLDNMTISFVFWCPNKGHETITISEVTKPFLNCSQIGFAIKEKITQCGRSLIFIYNLHETRIYTTMKLDNVPRSFGVVNVTKQSVVYTFTCRSFCLFMSVEYVFICLSVSLSE